MTEQHPYAEIAEMDRKYRERKAAIRADGALSYEAKERKVRALGLEHAARRKEAERSIEGWVA